MPLNRWKLWLCSVILAGFAPLSQADDPATVEVGGANIRIAMPQGFVDGATAGPNAPSFSRTPPANGNRRLMFLMREGDAATLRDGGKPFMKRFGELQAPGSPQKGVVTGEMFRFVSSIVKKQIIGDQQTLDRLIKKGFEEAKAKKGNAADTATVALGETKPLAVLRDDDQGFTVLLMTHVSMNQGDVPITVPVVTSMTLLRLQGKIIYAYLFSLYQDDSDTEWLKSNTQDWVGRLLAANP